MLSQKQNKFKIDSFEPILFFFLSYNAEDRGSTHQHH